VIPESIRRLGWRRDLFRLTKCQAPRRSAGIQPAGIQPGEAFGHFFEYLPVRRN